jgi:hypothetical protein
MAEIIFGGLFALCALGFLVAGILARTNTALPVALCVVMIIVVLW